LNSKPVSVALAANPKHETNRGLSRFVVRATCFVSLQLILGAIVLFYGSASDSNHYLLALHDKLARLETCQGNRLVVLGGSNVAFGIHSQELQRATGMETVNLGLHMSLGLHLPIECVRQHGRCGDVVILMPEYQLLTSHIQEGDPVTIRQLLEQWPQATRYFDQDRYASWKQFLDHDALWKAHQCFKRAWHKMTGRDLNQGIYRRSSFNQYGDMVAHYGRDAGSISQNEPLPHVNQQCLDEAVELLNAFSRECEERGITVYFSYPPIPESRFVSSASVVKEIHRELQSRLEMPLLNRPEEFVFSSDNFYDTSYHLNETGGEHRTRAVAEALMARSRITSGTPNTFTR
jgi:hypothetical protein